MNILNWARIKQNAIRFVILQLFLTLVSLPIIIAWGLPISALSPLGNFIFSPVLTLFLLVSSLLFFCELLHIPNTWLALLLEYITTLWHMLLGWANNTGLFAFSKPPAWALVSIPVVTLYAVSRLQKPLRTIIGLGLLFIATAVLLKAFNSPERTVHYIPCNNGHVTLVRDNNQLVLIDPGVIGSRPSASSWVSYTLIPEIIKQTGALTIDHLVVCKLNTIIFEALTTLCTKITVKNLYLPKWYGMLPHAAWFNFKKLRDNYTTVHRINNFSKSIFLTPSAHTAIQIEPNEKKQTYKEITYPTIQVIGHVDNQPLTIYAAQHKNSHN